MMAIGSRGGAVQLADHNAIAPDAGVYDDDEVVRGCEQVNDQSNGMNDDMHSNDGAPAIVLEYPPGSFTGTNALADTVSSSEASW